MKKTKVALAFLMLIFLNTALANESNTPSDQPSNYLNNQVEYNEPINIELKPFNPLLEHQKETFIQYEDAEILRKVADEENKKTTMLNKLTNLIGHLFHFMYFITHVFYEKIAFLTFTLV